jgi:hypothetical protein
MTDRQKALIKLALIGGAIWLAYVIPPLLGRFLSHDAQTNLILGLVFAGGAIYAFTIRKQMHSFVMDWPKSLPYTAVILYGCKILAEKVINARTGIEVENIRHSSTLGGFIYSIPFSMLLISLCMYAKMAFGFLFSSPAGGTGWRATIITFLKLCFIASVFWLGFEGMYRSDAIMTYTVLADTTKINTCGPVEPDVMYVRKNSETCKRIHVNPFKGIYESTDVPNKSG